MKNQSFLNKVMNAITGLRFAWQDERNFRVQVVLALLASLLFTIIQPDAIWWALITLCIALVLAAELINSAANTKAIQSVMSAHQIASG